MIRVSPPEVTSNGKRKSSIAAMKHALLVVIIWSSSLTLLFIQMRRFVWLPNDDGKCGGYLLTKEEHDWSLDSCVLLPTASKSLTTLSPVRQEG
jgi:hypothetical protein